MTFIKHPQENNKDQQAVQQMEQYLNSKKRVAKTALTAKRYGSATQKSMNPVVNDLYHALIKKVKQLLANLPDKVDRVIIELDNEKHPLDSHGLHTFISSRFYFYLECDYYGSYRIEYLFYNCSFEAQIRQMMKELSLNSYSTETVFSKDYSKFFNDVLRVQPERFIHLL